jgi:hypothetical protein
LLSFPSGTNNKQVYKKVVEKLNSYIKLEKKHQFSISKSFHNGVDKGKPLSKDNARFEYEEGISIVVDWKPEDYNWIHTVLENFATHESVRDTTDDELEVSLKDCLDLFTEEEDLTHSNSWFCSGCKKQVPSKKKLTLKTLPPVLIVHLKRFQYTTIYRDKITSLVNFPINDLDLSSFVMDAEPKPNYNLFAISNHIGGMSGGHYTSYVLNETDQTWYKLDDSHPSIQNSSHIVTPDAYLLFYKRTDNQTYEWPEPIQIDDEEDPVSKPSASSSSPKEEPKQSKDTNTVKSPPAVSPSLHNYDPVVTPDDVGFHPGYDSDYPPYMMEGRERGRNSLSNSLYICAYCNSPLPSLEEYQVHLLTEHYDVVDS